MKKIYYILAALCLCITSCKDNSDVSQQTSSLTGLWRVYNSSYPLWYRFSAGSIAEQFLYIPDKKEYDYYQGTFKVSNDQLTIKYQKERIFMMEEVLRCLAEFPEPQPEWKSETFLITNIGKDEIEVSYNKAKVRFVRVDALSSPWLDECSEPEIVATKHDLASKWDLRSYYTLDGNDYHAWFIQTPEIQGMTFLESGECADAQFWVNCIYAIEYNANRLSSNDGIYVQHKDCAWSVKDDVLFMTCVSYEKIKYDNSGNEISRTTVTPENPILVQFKIHMYTENWLTLYFSENKCYFSFHRHPSAGQAPSARSSHSSSNQLILGNHSHSFNEQLIEKND